jgi:4,5-DOPA dioxygenase extradiol
MILESSNKSETMPALFIGHGSPMNTVKDNEFTKSLANLGRTLPKPKAIMVVSAHWLTQGTYVTCTRKPQTIHDFYGFPEELYTIDYPSPGAPDYARSVTQLSNGQIRCDNDWGLDHASWAVLRHIYPEADIPVFEMSLDYSFNEWQPKPLEYHYKLAYRLRELRTKGVLIMGSGNIVHNLRVVDFEHVDAKPYDWAVEFDEKVRSDLIRENHEALLNCEKGCEATPYAVPTLDHYLPMIYVVATRAKNERVAFTYEGFQNRSVSMRCFRIG